MRGSNLEQENENLWDGSLGYGEPQNEDTGMKTWKCGNENEDMRLWEWEWEHGNEKLGVAVKDATYMYM